MTKELEKKWMEEFAEYAWRSYDFLDREQNDQSERWDEMLGSYLQARQKAQAEYDELLNKCAELNLQNNILKSELNQQKFNNKHNLSIDQQISDEMERLKTKLQRMQDNVLASVIPLIDDYDKENTELKNELNELRTGSKGACFACEPVGIKNKEMKKLLKECKIDLLSWCDKKELDADDTHEIIAKIDKLLEE